MEYIYEPWKASLDLQEKAGCIIGKDYPERIVDHRQASLHNRQVSEAYSHIYNTETANENTLYML